MAPLSLWSRLALLGAVANAQVATYSKNGAGLAVNIPANTAAGSSNEIYFQITAPSGTKWVSFGQGNSMSGSNMFVVYAASDSNVTVSPRLGTGYDMPKFNPSAQISVLDGTGIHTDGSFIANVRCDNCLSWSGGSMDPKSTSASWIWAIKSGSAINSASTSESFNIHDQQGVFKLDLTSGTGGSSNNPLIPATSTDGSASPSSSSGASAPIASSSPSSGSSSSSGDTSSPTSDNTSQVRTAHATIMSLVFLVMFPIAALTIYLPFASKVRYIHAPLQILALILTIIGLALGVVLGQRVHQLDAYHQIIGYIVVGVLIIFQPALGIIQHLHFTKTGGKSPMGIAHRWLGRTMIILGIINGGLGFMQSGPVGSAHVPSYSVVAYSVVAGVVFVVYIAVLLATSFRSKHSTKQPRVGEKYRGGREHDGYQMQHSPQGDGRRFQSEPKPVNPNIYTISHPNSGYGYSQGQTYR